MQIVKPYAHMVYLDSGSQSVFTPQIGLGLLRKIEWCGRISHRSEDGQTEDSWKRFIEAVVLGHGDWSITEHASVSVDMLVDRGITHELVRHRLFSFTQESTRFVNYEKKMPPSFVQPSLSREQEMCWNSAIQECEGMYKQLLALGCTPQIARSVFPNALASRVIVTGNLRVWRHLLLMRTSKETHPQFKQVSIPLLAEFKANIPLLFEDIESEARQTDNMRKPR